MGHRPPDERIDCGACEPICPVKAIFPEDEAPVQGKRYTEINADCYRLREEQFKEKWGAAP